jgi:glycosyltransferase involved in cell wall biosynthesis
MTIPAKLQSSMACGKPILLSASGEAQDIVKQANCGFVSNAGDYERLVQNIKKIEKLDKSKIDRLGENSRRYFEDNFEKEKLLEVMDHYINEGL